MFSSELVWVLKLGLPKQMLLILNPKKLEECCCPTCVSKLSCLLHGHVQEFWGSQGETTASSFVYTTLRGSHCSRKGFGLHLDVWVGCCWGKWVPWWEGGISPTWGCVRAARSAPPAVDTSGFPMRKWHLGLPHSLTRRIFCPPLPKLRCWVGCSHLPVHLRHSGGRKRKPFWKSQRNYSHLLRHCFPFLPARMLVSDAK